MILTVGISSLRNRSREAPWAWTACALLVLILPAGLDGQTRESRLDRVFTGLAYRPLTQVEARIMIDAPESPGSDRTGDDASAVSPHDPSVRYRTGERVLRSMDGGASWTAMGPELSDPGAFTTVVESPLEPGLIWVGASDGSLRLTRDRGASWALLEGPAPDGASIEMVAASAHRGGRAYVVAKGSDEGPPLVYRTDDYGSEWTLLSGEFSGLPPEHGVTVVREDPEREGLLFAGTPVGVFVTFDDGGSWDLFQFGLPDAPVTDVRILGRDLVVDLVDRGRWVMDEIGPLRQVMDGLTTGEPYLFEPSPIYLDRLPVDEGISDARGAIFDYLLPSIVRTVHLEVLDAHGRTLVTFTGVRGSGAGAPPGTADSDFRRVPGTRSGVHRITWDLTTPDSGSGDVERVPPGNYLLRMTVDGFMRERPFEVVRGGSGL